MKLPKTFSKMNFHEQEKYLVKKLTELYQQEETLKVLLATIRGGKKLNFEEVERPDEAILKRL